MGRGKAVSIDLVLLQTTGRRRIVALTLASACAALQGCAGIPAALDEYGQAPHQAALAPDLEARVSQAMPALVDQRAGIELRNCADLLDALRLSKDLGEIAERPQFNAYVDCLMPAMLAEGRGVRAAGLGLQGAGERLYRALDLATVPSSLAPRRPAAHYRLSDFSGGSVQIAPLSVDMQLDGFSYQFKVLAVGDFQHAGQTEWLVQFTDRATGAGSYHRRALLVIDASGSSGPVLAVDAMAVLNAGGRRAKAVVTP